MPHRFKIFIPSPPIQFYGRFGSQYAKNSTSGNQTCCFFACKLSSSVCKAVAAVDGTVAAGLERNLAFLAALGADCIVHHALGTSSDTLAGCTAGSAALGLVLEAALCVELLLTGGENELVAAICAN
jgi:hypothetical protein